jgi:hypothetical protein
MLPGSTQRAAHFHSSPQLQYLLTAELASEGTLLRHVKKKEQLCLKKLKFKQTLKSTDNVGILYH